MLYVLRGLGVLCESTLERGKSEGEPLGSFCSRLAGERWLAQWRVHGYFGRRANGTWVECDR